MLLLKQQPNRTLSGPRTGTATGTDTANFGDRAPDVMGQQQSANELNAMRKISSAVLAMALTAILFGLGAPSAQAQRRVQLIDFTTTSWRYNASGTDQGRAWRSRTFADAAWPSGMGLLGGFSGALDVYPYPFNTIISPYNDQIITYYFRAHFNMAASDFIWPLTLVMSNLVDDGCVVYLNSNQVALIRVPADPAFNTPATGGPAAEGAYEPTIMPMTNGLVVGDNVIAVEVHQNATGSSDITLGLSLTAIVPTALAIASQPPSQLTTTVGQSVILSVGVSGGPALYQWQTNNGVGTYVNVPGATAASYTFTPSAAGTNVFRAVASNGVNMVISTTCTVTALADKSGPLMLSAIVLEEATRTNRIQIAWNENLLTSTVNLQSATNFSVMLIPSNIVVGISNVQYNPGTYPLPGIPPTVTLTMNTTNWHIRTNYCIVVNNVRDARNNVIAPNSRICVSWATTTNVMQMGDAWDYFDSYVFVPTIFSQSPPWMATNYVVDYNNGWGGQFNSCGIYYKDPNSQILNCAGDSLCTEVSIQNQPTLFRRTFTLPSSVTNGTVQLKLRYILDDGAVIFLNGKELLRVNMPGVRGDPITDTTLATANVANPTCVTNDNVPVPVDIPFFPGINWMAVAVCQGNPLPPNNAEDVAFGLEMDVRVYSSPPVLPNPVPRMIVSKPTATSARISWPSGYGYALEVKSSMVGGTWMEAQTNMANPMVISNLSTMGGSCFFRLRKVQLQ